MSVVANVVKPSFYMDSVALMRFSREIAGKAGVEDAALMMGTPANLQIMADAGVLGDDGKAATAGDLVIAIRASREDVAKAVMSEAEAFLEQPARKHQCRRRLAAKDIARWIESDAGCQSGADFSAGRLCRRRGKKGASSWTSRDDVQRQCINPSGNRAQAGSEGGRPPFDGPGLRHGDHQWGASGICQSNSAR